MVAMPFTSKAIIELQDLTHDYFRADGSVMVRALKHIDVSIDEGEYVTIMGQSGSGKSTLMNILGCLDPPTHGRYLLRGKDVAQLGDNALSTVRGKEIGFVFQSFNLIPELTVSENIEVPLFYRGVPRHERHKRAASMLERVGLQDRKTHRPMQLSGGQQQRVAIARALVGDPAILLADEPTGNLDSATGAAIMTLLDDLNAEGRTVIMVTHDEVIARRSRRILRLLDGQVESDQSSAGLDGHL